MTLRSRTFPQSDKASESTAVVHSTRLLAISKRRELPRFIIADASMNVVSCSPRLEQKFTALELQSLTPLCRECQLSNQAVYHVFDPDTVLRIVPLDQSLFGCVAIFVENFGHRGSIFAAAKVFALTRRESEVLQLILRATTNVEIARLLCVAESTVADHVKSIMRKLGTTKRAEIITRVFKLEEDVSANNVKPL